MPLLLRHRLLLLRIRQLLLRALLLLRATLLLRLPPLLRTLALLLRTQALRLRLLLRAQASKLRSRDAHPGPRSRWASQRIAVRSAACVKRATDIRRASKKATNSRSWLFCYAARMKLHET